MAAHRLADFPRALAETIAADGDCDTNAAIVGGIVAPFVGRAVIPVAWLASRERVSI
jgi:ADP-ribosylglycohydrolase